jgi:hypothetical protein
MVPTTFNIFPSLIFSLSLTLSSCLSVVPTSYYLSRQTSPSSSRYHPAHPTCPPLTYPTCPPLTSAPSRIFPSSFSSFTFPPVVPTSYNLSLPPIIPSSSLSLSHAYSSTPSTPAPTFLPTPSSHPPPTHPPPPTVHPDTPVLARPANRAHPN